MFFFFLEVDLALFTPVDKTLPWLPSLVAHACNSGTGTQEAGGEFGANLDYIFSSHPDP